jgi:hypothetical protein
MMLWSQDNSVCIEAGYGLDVQCSIPSRGKGFFLLHGIQTGSEVHPALYTVGTRGLFPWEVKQLLCEADYSPPSNAEVNNAPTPTRLHGMMLN